MEGQSGSHGSWPGNVWLFKTLALIGVLALAFIVRYTGIRHGEPSLVYHPDVPKQIWVAIKHERGVLDLRRQYKDDVELTMYPYGTAIASAYLARLESLLGGSAALHDRNLWRWALSFRHLSLLLAMGSFALVLGWLARRWRTWPVFVTGLLLVLDPIHAQFSHHAMNDVPLVSLLLLAWLLSAHMPDDAPGRPWRSLGTGLILGLSFGVKYQALLAGIFPLAAWVLAWRQGRRGSWFAASVAALALGGIAGVWCATPMLRQDPVYFIQQFPAFMSWQAHITGQHIPLATKISHNFVYMEQILWKDGHLWLVIIAALSPFVLLRRGTGATIHLLAATALLFPAALVASILLSRDYARAADLLPIMTFLILPVGFMLNELFASGHAARRRFAQALSVLLALLALRMGASSYADARAFARTDTRALARAWCQENLPPAAVVRRELYTLAIGRADIVDRDHRYLSEPEPVRIIRAGHYDYLITSSLAHGRFKNKNLPCYDPASAEFYNKLEKQNDLVAEFRDRELYFAQPVIRIYRKKATAQLPPANET